MQTTDLELSKLLYEKLKKAGVDVNNYYYINIFGDRITGLSKYGLGSLVFPAYTLDEVVVVLPVEVVSNKSVYVYTHDRYLSLPENEVMNSFGYYHPEKQHWLSVFSDFNPTQSAGELLEWCLDNGHIGANDDRSNI